MNKKIGIVFFHRWSLEVIEVKGDPWAHRPRIDLNKRFLPRSNTGKKLVQFEWNEDFPETID